MIVGKLPDISLHTGHIALRVAAAIECRCVQLLSGSTPGLPWICCGGCCGGCVEWLRLVPQPPHALTAHLDVELLLSDIKFLVDDTAPSRALSECRCRDSVMRVAHHPSTATALGSVWHNCTSSSSPQGTCALLGVCTCRLLRHQQAMLMSDSSATCTHLRPWWVVIQVRRLSLLSVTDTRTRQHGVVNTPSTLVYLPLIWHRHQPTCKPSTQLAVACWTLQLKHGWPSAALLNCLATWWFCPVTCAIAAALIRIQFVVVLGPAFCRRCVAHD